MKEVKITIYGDIGELDVRDIQTPCQNEDGSESLQISHKCDWDTGSSISIEIEDQAVWAWSFEGHTAAYTAAMLLCDFITEKRRDSYFSNFWSQIWLLELVKTEAGHGPGVSTDLLPQLRELAALAISDELSQEESAA